ncbi:MAG: GNAT family N-acetyltransferase [Burkholderiaceae bacterium]|jgi:putative acetyltransferase|nr:GNAT family N-acetyltransferase [Burkholderiaceae bacterium]
MSELLIRRMEPDDAEGVAATFRDPGVAAGTLQNPYPSTAEWVKKLAANDPQTHYGFVAITDGRVVGHAGLHGQLNRRRAHAWLLGIAVADDWQRRGIGTRLMSTLIDLADHWLGALRIELTVFTDNDHARRLYERFGFVVEGTHRAYALRHGVLTDVHAMARLHPNPPTLLTQESPR